MFTSSDVLRMRGLVVLVAVLAGAGWCAAEGVSAADEPAAAGAEATPPHNVKPVRAQAGGGFGGGFGGGGFAGGGFGGAFSGTSGEPAGDRGQKSKKTIGESACSPGALSIRAVSVDSANARLEAALAVETVTDFVEAPLVEVLQYLADLHKIEVHLDSRALEDMGIEPDQPVSMHLKAVTLAGTLALLCETVPELDWRLEGGVLVITSRAQSDEHPDYRIYLAASAQQAELVADLLTSIVDELDPSQVWHGGRWLAVRAPQRVQRTIQRLIEMLVRSQLEP